MSERTRCFATVAATSTSNPIPTFITLRPSPYPAVFVDIMSHLEFTADSSRDGAMLLDLLQTVASGKADNLSKSESKRDDVAVPSAAHCVVNAATARALLIAALLAEDVDSDVASSTPASSIDVSPARGLFPASASPFRGVPLDRGTAPFPLPTALHGHVSAVSGAANAGLVRAATLLQPMTAMAGGGDILWAGTSAGTGAVTAGTGGNAAVPAVLQALVRTWVALYTPVATSSAATSSTALTLGAPRLLRPLPLPISLSSHAILGLATASPFALSRAGDVPRVAGTAAAAAAATTASASTAVASALTPLAATAAAASPDPDPAWSPLLADSVAQSRCFLLLGVLDLACDCPRAVLPLSLLLGTALPFGHAMGLSPGASSTRRGLTLVNTVVTQAYTRLVRLHRGMPIVPGVPPHPIPPAALASGSSAITSASIRSSQTPAFAPLEATAALVQSLDIAFVAANAAALHLIPAAAEGWAPTATQPLSAPLRLAAELRQHLAFYCTLVTSHYPSHVPINGVAQLVRTLSELLPEHDPLLLTALHALALRARVILERVAPTRIEALLDAVHRVASEHASGYPSIQRGDGAGGDVATTTRAGAARARTAEQALARLGKAQAIAEIILGTVLAGDVAADTSDVAKPGKELVVPVSTEVQPIKNGAIVGAVTEAGTLALAPHISLPIPLPRLRTKQGFVLSFACHIFACFVSVLFPPASHSHQARAATAVAVSSARSDDRRRLPGLRTRRHRRRHPG